jgi:hypothetical protein
MSRKWITVFVNVAAIGLSVTVASAQRGTPPVVPGAAHTPPGSAAKTTAPNTTTVAQRIDAHPRLAARLTPLLPAGMTLDQAAQGFKNQGQFIAALHVSHNLDIPFDTLKTEMTGPNHKNLGAAIHDLKPTANATAEARKADADAKADLKAASEPADHEASK